LATQPTMGAPIEVSAKGDANAQGHDNGLAWLVSVESCMMVLVPFAKDEGRRAEDDESGREPPV